MKFKNKSCQVCGAVFTPTATTTKVCGDSCRKVWNKERDRAWAEKKQQEKSKEWKIEKQCEICRSCFVPRQPTQKYCSKKCLQKGKQKGIAFQKMSSKANKKHRNSLRIKFHAMYGSICVRCGEAEMIFLTVDHKNNDGHIERQLLNDESGRKTLRKAIQVYNPIDYQVLCFNCNCGKNRNNVEYPHRKDRIDEVIDVAGRRYRQNLWKNFFDLYGCSCVCCGEKCLDFLTIDHKQNDGNMERRKLGSGEPYKSLRKALKKYNPNKYQPLCFNCNCGRSRNKGICPHQVESIPTTVEKEVYND